MQAYIGLWAILLGLALASCSTTKTVPLGQYLYTGADVVIDAPDSVDTKNLERELEGLLAPRTNRSILGLPFGLWAYNFFDTPKEKGLFPWLQRTLGDEPILYDDAYQDPIISLLGNRSFNRGFFQNQVEAQVDSSNKKAHINYLVEVQAPYTILSYSRDFSDSTLAALVEDVDPEAILQVGNTYSLEDLKAERQRIEEYFREKGYFYFNRDNLLFHGDSLKVPGKIALTLSLKEDLPPETLQKAYLSSIHVYPNYQVDGPAIQGQVEVEDVIFHGTDLPLRPKPMLRALLFRPGDRYNATYQQRTQERLLGLPFLQFANVRFRPEAGIDSLLRMEIFLSPNLPHTIEGSVGLSHKSTHFLGPELALTYSNRNLFRGSELLRLSANANFNWPLRRSRGEYYEEIELSASLTRPGLLVPFLNHRSRTRLIGAGTTLEVNFKRQRASVPIKPDSLDASLYASFLQELGFNNLANNIREDSTYAPYIAINEPEIIFGYQWKIKQTITHFLNPIRFRFQSTTYEEDELERLLLLLILADTANASQNVQLFLNLQRMVIYQPEYIFVYDGRAGGIKKHNFFFRGRTSLAGNQVFNPKSFDVDLSVFNSRYLQFENDFRYFYHFPRRHVLAFRWMTNFSVPLGGRELLLPFFDFYSVGGPNSIRAFGTRELGPGTRSPDEQGISNIIRGKGDIKLETSVEYRHRLTSMFELGFFVDAGNVWVFKKGTSSTSEVQFQMKDFYRELGVGVGTGLRVLLSGLVIRLDFGVPVRKPWYPEGERWMPDGFKPGLPDWRRENLVWNLAFGYSF